MLTAHPPGWPTTEQRDYPVTLRVEGDGYVAHYRFVSEAARDAWVAARILKADND